MSLPGIIVTDQNAATDWARFYTVSEGLGVISADRVFARFWTHPNDLYDQIRHKAEKCAEVLVPDCVDPQYILGAYVANEIALSKFQQLNCRLPVQVRGDIFF